MRHPVHWANDTDVDGDTLQPVAATQPAHGQLYGNADGSFTYIPNAGYVGADPFTYTVTDGKGGTATGTVNITVTGVNAPPVATGGTITTAKTPPRPPRCRPPTPTAPRSPTPSPSSPPRAPSPTSAATTGTYTYTPAANYNGTDSFNYTVSDGITTSAPATITVTVTAVNDAPVAGGDIVSTPTDTPSTRRCPPPTSDGQTLTYTITQQPTNGTHLQLQHHHRRLHLHPEHQLHRRRQLHLHRL